MQGRVGRVELVVRSGAESVEISVEDNGPGFSLRDQEELFVAFRSTKATKGRGVGLSLVRALVARAGGTLAVRSAPGAGGLHPIDSFVVFADNRVADRISART